MTSKDWKKLHWTIVGGESGTKARRMHPEWARMIREDCVKHGVREDLWHGKASFSGRGNNVTLSSCGKVML